MTTEDKLLEELKNYENQWVAISIEPEEKVVGSGESAFAAKRDAESKGYTDTALFWVLPFDVGYATEYAIPIS